MAARCASPSSFILRVFGGDDVPSLPRKRLDDSFPLKQFQCLAHGWPTYSVFRAESMFPRQFASGWILACSDFAANLRRDALIRQIARFWRTRHVSSSGASFNMTRSFQEFKCLANRGTRYLESLGQLQLSWNLSACRNYALGNLPT